MSLATSPRSRLGSPRELDPRLIVILACVAAFGLTALLLGYGAASLFGVVPIAVLLTIVVRRHGATAFDRAWIVGRNRVAERGMAEKTESSVEPRDTPPILPTQR
jgi:hypothetical protein